MRTIILIFVVCMIVISAHAVTSLVIEDSIGKAMGSLPLVLRGDDAMIPLSALAHKANWEEDNSEGRYVIMIPGQTIILRNGNPFARCGTRFVQMRVAPDEWDGSLWVPVSILGDVFGDELKLNVNRDIIRLRNVSSSPPQMNALPPPPKETAPQPALTSVVKPDTTKSLPASAIKTEAWSLKTVIIDPGHGGKDPGALGLFNLREKTITLDIARRLATLLESNGIHTELSRNGDQFVSLHDRTSMANSHHGDLFISIHCNSNRDPSIQGASTYFLKPARTPNAINAAMRENSVVQLEDSATEYQDLTEQNYILMTMATSQYMKDSEMLADLAVRETAKSTELESRGVDQAGFYVLIGASMPAVLVECGYVSNPEDARLLSTERGRQKIAGGLRNSIVNIKRELETAASR
jgi:N-acetylmuramoyl-L-alanine amidase